MNARRAQRLSAAASLALALPACGHVTAAGDRPADTPAVLVAPTAEVQAELDAAVAAALNGRPVRLAPDALTASDLLIVEGPRTDRDLGSVTRFRLVRRDSSCVLVHEAGGFERVLRRARCEAAAAD